MYRIFNRILLLSFPFLTEIKSPSIMHVRSWPETNCTSIYFLFLHVSDDNTGIDTADFDLTLPPTTRPPELLQSNLINRQSAAEITSYASHSCRYSAVLCADASWDLFTELQPAVIRKLETVSCTGMPRRRSDPPSAKRVSFIVCCFLWRLRTQTYRVGCCLYLSFFPNIFSWD